VYGVAVPDSDGRAGMAALTVSGEFALPELRRRLAAALPAYARPLFIRIVGALELTGTFKQRKQQLALEGYDVARITDPLYLDDAAAGEYRPLDAALHRRLVAGELRL
jgi:fatty-acyl-CoA synthase